MAYISQEEKKELAPGIKAVFKKYGVKGSISIKHYSKLTVTIREGVLDFIGDVNAARKERAERQGDDFYPCDGHYQANPYHADSSAKDPKINQFFKELIAAMKGTKWYDNSEVQTDYFDTAYYLSINIGKWDKGYNLVTA